MSVLRPTENDRERGRFAAALVKAMARATKAPVLVVLGVIAGASLATMGVVTTLQSRDADSAKLAALNERDRTLGELIAQATDPGERLQLMQERQEVREKIREITRRMALKDRGPRVVSGGGSDAETPGRVPVTPGTPRSTFGAQDLPAAPLASAPGGSSALPPYAPPGVDDADPRVGEPLPDPASDPAMAPGIPHSPAPVPESTLRRSTWQHEGRFWITLTTPGDDLPRHERLDDALRRLLPGD